MKKLSECVKADQIFLYNRETVGLQYILKKIFTGEKLLEIRLVEDDKNLDDAISGVLEQIYKDVQNGVVKEDYELNNIHSQVVIVDITKENIKQLDEYKFAIQNIN